MIPIHEYPHNVQAGGVFVRVTAGVGGSQLGALRGDYDAGSCLPLGGAAWRSTSCAGELAIIAVNLPGTVGETGATGPTGPTGPEGPPGP